MQNDLLARFVMPACRSVAKEEEIFAIGDVHGYADQLADVLAAIAASKRQAPRRRLIFLGDLIDRGPASLRAMDIAIDARKLAKADLVTSLWGNHESMLAGGIDVNLSHGDRLDFLECWLRNGGVKVLSELGVRPERLGVDYALADALGEQRVAFLRDRVSHILSGDVLFVHAGLPPRQTLEDLFARPWNTPLELLDEDAHWLWTRWPFLLPEGHPKGLHAHLFVVHGHTTPHHDPTSASQQAQMGRLNLDGGTYSRGGAIRWARFVGRTVELFGDATRETAFADDLRNAC